MALGAAVEGCMSSFCPPEAGNIAEVQFTDQSHGELKVAASVASLQHKLASRSASRLADCLMSSFITTAIGQERMNSICQATCTDISKATASCNLLHHTEKSVFRVRMTA